MGERASLIATLAEPPDDGVLAALPRSVDWLELRADLCGEVPAAWLRARFPGRLLYTLRSRGEGGAFEGSLSRRRQRLAAAAAEFDWIDLEAERDLHDPLLQEVPVEKRVVSWHGPGREASQLERQFQTMAQVPAALYKLVPLARESSEEVAALELLVDLGRRDVLCFAAGESGVWTRYIAPYLGAPILLGAAGAKAGAPGQPTVARIARDYPFPELPAVDTLYGIVGNPVAHSLSPRLHNGAYRALGIAALFVPFGPSSFADFWLEVIEGNVLGAFAPLVGLSITAPYKSAAAAVAGALSPLAQSIDSANTLVLREGVWEGETTDPQGVIGALEAAGIEPRGRRAAVVGCGGAGRAAAAGLKRAGAETVLVNRTVETGVAVAGALELPFEALAEFDPARWDIVVNATSLGHSAGDALAFDPERLAPGAAVVDLVYGEHPTALLDRVRELGMVGVDGREVLLHQGMDQFRLMTGRELPVELGRELLALPAAQRVS
ncbi:MAG TPA: type I 3-dehydroquinate dehydratase [Thermoanaerobaculia bacterium]|nr:type I 3-dehydroquinate dehydratase [Thermoanaerobaculia bacterium]